MGKIQNFDLFILKKEMNKCGNINLYLKIMVFFC